MDMSQHPAEAVNTFTPESETERKQSRATLIAYFTLALIIAGWAASVATFGVIGFTLPAVASVPLIFILLIRITLG
ncbi:MAG TPA: hypothetical protein ENJ91_08735 [Rhodobacteraceae bacterium]|nr:hypothetical protein [Paracoccaceae bacterium]